MAIAKGKLAAKKGQGTVEYILLVAVIVSAAVILYRTFERKMLPIAISIKNKLEGEAQWGGRPAVDSYYVNGSGPHADARILVNRGI